MKFLCAKSDFENVISICQRAVAVRSTIVILECLLIEADEELRVTGYDTHIGIKASCFAEVRETGSLAITAKLINDVVRKMPEGMILFEQIENGMVELSCGTAKFQLKALSADTYPKIPELNKADAKQLVFEQKMLKQMIAKTLFSVSTDVARPSLNGALLQSGENICEMVAIDGFRLALYREERKEDAPEWPEIKAIIPGKTLRELESILNSDEEIRIFSTENHILFEFGTIIFISSLVQGEYLDHERFLPKTFSSVLFADTKEILDCVERALLLVTNEDTRFPISIKSEDQNKLHVDINSMRGSFSEVISVKVEGDPVEGDFNPRFLLDALKVIEDKTIKMTFSGKVGPCVIRPEKGENFAYLLLPLRNFN